MRRGAPLHGDRGLRHPGVPSPSLLTSAPSSPGLAAPRRGSHAPRARRAPGPTERSPSPPALPPPPSRTAPRRAGEEEQGEARRGWAGGDAPGGAGCREARGPGGAGRDAARGDGSEPRSPRLRAVLRGPLWEQPYVNPARLYTPLPPRRGEPRRSGLGFD